MHRPKSVPARSKESALHFLRFSFQLNYSNGTVALLRNVGFIHAGNVSCEVTMDAPTFKVKSAYGVLRVVSLPRTRPELRVDKDRLSVGDPLSANCTSGPSRPRSALSFYINNFPVSTLFLPGDRP